MRAFTLKSARSYLAILAPGLAVALAATAEAGPVKGRIAGAEKLFPEAYAEAAKPDGHNYTWREPSPTVRQEFRALTASPSRDICIAAISSQAAPKREPIASVITGGHAIPSTIVVAPGTTLSFMNHDPFSHRFFQVGSDAFKADEMQTGKHRDWVAPPTPGRFEFKDALFPSVRFSVVVEPGVVDVVYPVRAGAFAFRDLPPGDYSLRAFFGGRQVGKSVAVVATKGSVELKDAINLAEAPTP